MAKSDSGDERFESILGRLREVVERLEGGELPLEEALHAFEDGVRLTRRGMAILDAAEKRVELLTAGGQVEPFPEGGAAGEADAGERPAPATEPGAGQARRGGSR